MVDAAQEIIRGHALPGLEASFLKVLPAQNYLPLSSCANLLTAQTCLPAGLIPSEALLLDWCATLWLRKLVSAQHETQYQDFWDSQVPRRRRARTFSGERKAAKLQSGL